MLIDPDSVKVLIYNQPVDMLTSNRRTFGNGRRTAAGVSHFGDLVCVLQPRQGQA